MPAETLAEVITRAFMGIELQVIPNRRAMRVAVKFCGGCDPTYERTELLRRVKDRAADAIEWIEYDANGEDVVLIISGCRRACPEQEFPLHRRHVSVTDAGFPPEHVVAQLLGKGDRNAHQDQR